MDMVRRGIDPRAWVPTGFRDIDARGGNKRGMLTLYGAATGEGKSIWGKALFEGAAKAGYTADVYSFEDPLERTLDRSFSSLTDVPSTRMRDLKLTPQEVVQIGLAADEIDRIFEANFSQLFHS